MNSYKQKFQDLKILLKEHTPLCVCLKKYQEYKVNPPSMYEIVTSEITRQDGHERGYAHDRLVSIDPQKSAA